MSKRSNHRELAVGVIGLLMLALGAWALIHMFLHPETIATSDIFLYLLCLVAGVIGAHLVGADQPVPKQAAPKSATVMSVPMPPPNPDQAGMSEERRQYLASHVPPELRGGTRPVVNTAQYARQLNKKNPAICPKCGSSNTEYLGKKGGVDGSRMVAGAAIGAAVGGGVGELAGAAVGATTGKNKEMLCRDCGHRWTFK